MTRPQLPPRVEELAWEIDAEAFIRQRDEHPDVTAEKDARAERAIAEADRRMRHNLERFGRPYKAPKPDHPTCSHIIGPNGVTVAVMSDDGPTPERVRQAEDVNPKTGEVYAGLTREKTRDDETGEVRHPFKIKDDIYKMFDKGQISEDEAKAAWRFRDEFEIAGHDPRRAADLSRQGGKGGGAPGDRIQMARDYVYECLCHVAGRKASPMSAPACQALWWVIGAGESHRSAAQRIGPWLSGQAVAGLVIAALGILAQPRR